MLLQVLLEAPRLGKESTHQDIPLGSLCSQSFPGQPLAQLDLEKPPQTPGPETPPSHTGVWEPSVSVPGIHLPDPW